MTDSETDLTCDAFLGGKLHLWQPKRGYRAGIDPVLLAASVPAKPGQSVLDLGCGAGAALFCLSTRVSQLELTGVEMQAEYAALARRNGLENAIACDIVEADLTQLPPDLRQRRFDHILANPPYFEPEHSSRAPNPGRETARAEQTPLSDWIETAARRLAPRGTLSLIQRIQRLPDLLAACSGRLGSVEILPLSARAGRAPHLLILRARKGGRAAFHLHAPLVLHHGAQHIRDQDSYTAEIAPILRQGAALHWPNRAR